MFEDDFLQVISYNIMGTGQEMMKDKEEVVKKKGGKKREEGKRKKRKKKKEEERRKRRVSWRILTAILQGKLHPCR